jgi:hypothetical protein
VGLYLPNNFFPLATCTFAAATTPSAVAFTISHLPSALQLPKRQRYLHSRTFYRSATLHLQVPVSQRWRKVLRLQVVDRSTQNCGLLLPVICLKIGSFVWFHPSDSSVASRPTPRCQLPIYGYLPSSIAGRVLSIEQLFRPSQTCQISHPRQDKRSSRRVPPSASQGLKDFAF